MGVGSSITSSLSNAVLGRFIEIPKGKKVTINIWRKATNVHTERPSTFRDEKIVGYLASDFTFEVGSQFTQPFDKASNAILNTIISGATGGQLSLINKYNQSYVFEKSDPLSLTLDLEFRTRYDSYLDVWRPITVLALESLPYTRGGGLLVSPTPNFFHFAGEIYNKIKQVTKQTVGKTSLGEHLKKITGKVSELFDNGIEKAIESAKNNTFTFIQVVVGDYFVLGPVLIDKASQTFSNELSASRIETLAKLLELAVRYTGGGSRGIGVLKLAEYGMNVPVLNLANTGFDDFSPSRRYPNSGKVSLGVKSLWGYTQTDAKKSMRIKTTYDKSKGLIVPKGQSIAEKMEELLDKAINKARNAPDTPAGDVAREIARATLGDLTPGGTL